MHFILQHAGKYGRKMSCLAKNAESFASFTISSMCVFKDSAQFLLTSLCEAVDGLNAAVTSDVTAATVFPLFSRAFVCLAKGGASPEGFPYDWYDSADKLSATSLPSKEHFSHSSLMSLSVTWMWSVQNGCTCGYVVPVVVAQ